jgi:tetratricopeptide (TPR) repeat protein/O-antigen ligase
MEAAWLAVVILTPLFYNIYSSRIFEPDKLTLLRSLALVILAAWVIKLIEERSAPGGRPVLSRTGLREILSTPLVAPVLALAVLYVLSTLFSVTPRISLWGSYQRLQGTYTTLSYLVIFAAVAANLRRRAQVERILSAAILASLPVSFYGILQRYGLDPIPWGGDVSRRIASNMGNSIFVAAYLIMVFPLTVTRAVQAFQGILRENSSRLYQHVALGSLYVFIAALQLTAQYMSGSRGPALGLMAGAFVLFLLLSVQWRARWLTYGAVAGVAALGIFLLLFNLSGGPFENLKDSPAIGRYGQLLNPESNNALVRTYIWQGAAELVAPHEPLEFPDGSLDTFNFLRPLLGYGPESMYVAFNSFYPPELGQVERRNASPDRSHNETWDALVISGISGLVLYLVIFASIFYYGLKWTGLITGGRQRALFFGFFAAGGLLGALGMILWRGIEYFGVGLPFGTMLGLIGYVTLAALFFKIEPAAPGGPAAARLTLIALLAAISAHYVEINFGIAISVTRAYFWIFAALLLAVGLLLPRMGQYQETEKPSAAGLERPGKDAQRRKGERRGRRRAESTSGGVSSRWGEAFTCGALTAFALVALGYNTITNPTQSTSSLEIIWDSFTRLYRQDNAFSLGVLAMVGLTWLAGALIFSAESAQESGDGGRLKLFGAALGISGLLALVFWLAHAGALVSLARFTPTNLAEVEIQVRSIGGLLTRLYAFVFLLLFGLAAFLPVERSARRAGTTVLGLGTAAVVFTAAIMLINYTNLRIIHADIAFKMAEPFNQSGSWPVATHLYKYANRLAPSEDHYYLFLGRSYLEQAKETSDLEQQASLVEEARADLLVAQRINPLNTDHTANLGRLYSWWASRTADPAERLERAEISSDYYSRALTLSPQNSTLWGEWSLVYLDIMGQPEQAYQRLSTALELDERYSWTQGLMGDFYFKSSRNAGDEQARRELLETAAAYYRRAVELAGSREAQIKTSNLVALANVYIELEDTANALQVYHEALDLQPSQSDRWRIEENLARLYAQLGDKSKAIVFANSALSNAPDDQTPRISSLIEQIEALP